MNFTSATFILLFLPFVVAVYYSPICKNENFRKKWLVFSSLVFYAWGQPVYALLLLFSTVVSWRLGRRLAPHAGTPAGKRIVAAACLYDLGMLFVFKNYLGWILGGAGAKETSAFLASHITFPLGISFFTFQAVSYIVDIYRKQETGENTFLDAALYLSFFPKITEGPIVRYKDFSAQAGKPERGADHLADGVWLAVIGLSKKVVFANHLYYLFAFIRGMEQADRSVATAWAGMLAYFLYIYFDFSGYSDMAAGIAKMFGFSFAPNFNYPYLSTSVSEFWRRWHISMGEFFREYVYYPLTIGPMVGFRKKIAGKVGRKASAKLAAGLTLLAVWLLTGIWHGADLTFVVWGLVNFVFVFYDQEKKKPKYPGLAAVRGWFVTMLVLVFSRVFFVSDSLTAAWGYLCSMLPLPGNALTDAFGSYLIFQYRTFLALGTVFCFPVVEKTGEALAKRFGEDSKAVMAWDTVKTAAMVILFLLDIVMVISGGYSPSVYQDI